MPPRPAKFLSRWLFLNVGLGWAAFAFVVFGLLEQDFSTGTASSIAVLGALAGCAGYAADPSRSGVLFSAFLLTIVIAVAHPFLHPTFVGAGDAQDYFRMFADFLEQRRAGIFEIFVGQTAFAFEGTVHTTRTSPLFYHLGAMVDLISFRTLGYLIVEKVTVFAFFIAIAQAFYLCAVRGLGLTSRLGLLIACIFLSAPGILAPIYFSDMYATFTSLPFLPIFLTAVILLGENPEAPGAWLLLGLGSGGLFWSHPAVALWVHLAAFFCLLVNWRRWRALRPHTLLRGIPIVLILAYPIVSAFALGTASVTNPHAVALEIRQYHYDYPGRWTHLLWISANRADPNSFLDWSFSWVFGVPVFVSWLIVLAMSRRARGAWPLILSSAVLVLMMNGLSPKSVLWLWKLVPDVVVRITLNWPLQRFNPIVTCSALIGLAGMIAQQEKEGLGPRLTRMILVIQGLFLGLNLLLVWQVQAVPAASTLSPALTREFVKSDNIVIPASNYTFVNSDVKFHYLTDGRSDPLSEIRLHDRADYDRVLDIFSLRGVVKPEFTRNLIYRRFNVPICARIEIPPRAVTALTFEGMPPDLQGELELRANGVPWAYPLPYATPGGDRAFGAGPLRRHSLLVRNSDPRPKELDLYFWPRPAARDRRAVLGTLSGYTVEPQDHYFSLNNVLPLEIDVNPPFPVALETPRIFLKGYEARVDGQAAPVFKSPEGLVSLNVPAGPHRVQVAFEADPFLKSCYRLALVAWLYFVGSGAFLLGKNVFGKSAGRAA